MKPPFITCFDATVVSFLNCFQELSTIHDAEVWEARLEKHLLPYFSDISRIRVDVASGSFMVHPTEQFLMNHTNSSIYPPVTYILSAMQTPDVIAFRHQSIRFDYFVKNTMQWIGGVILWNKQPDHPISRETLDFFRSLVGFFAFIIGTHPLNFLPDRDHQKTNQWGDNQLESTTTLTPQERKILNLISKGKKHREAADILNISVRTVNKHVENILRKTETHSIIEAMEVLGVH
ncbi:MAG: response regulator transcription factor [Candidatus Kapaibacterium sp.]